MRAEACYGTTRRGCLLDLGRKNEEEEKEEEEEGERRNCCKLASVVM